MLSMADLFGGDLFSSSFKLDSPYKLGSPPSYAPFKFDSPYEHRSFGSSPLLHQFDVSFGSSPPHHQSSNASRGSPPLYQFDAPFKFDIKRENSPDFLSSNSLSSSSSEHDCYGNDRAPGPTLYSLKVFFGGLPKYTTEAQVLRNVHKFGVSRIDFVQDAGYCFVVFKNQTCVQSFMSSCIHDVADEHYYFSFIRDVFSSSGDKVEIRPFKLHNAQYGQNGDRATVHSRSVFVGGVPRDTTAESLAMQLEMHYGSVAEISIDLDPSTLYPRGTAMAVFNDQRSAGKAIWSQTMTMKNVKGKKHRIIELKPYLDNFQTCLSCNNVGPSVFCNHPACMRVTCDRCFDAFHMSAPDRCHHKKITRGTYYTSRRFG